MLCLPARSTSSSVFLLQRLQRLLVSKLVTCPTGAPQAGVCQPRVPGSFSSSHGCTDPRQDGVRVTELQAGTHLAPHSELVAAGPIRLSWPCC